MMPRGNLPQSTSPHVERPLRRIKKIAQGIPCGGMLNKKGARRQFMQRIPDSKERVGGLSVNVIARLAVRNLPIMLSIENAT